MIDINGNLIMNRKDINGIVHPISEMDSQYIRNCINHLKVRMEMILDVYPGDSSAERARKNMGLYILAFCEELDRRGEPSPNITLDKDFNVIEETYEGFTFINIDQEPMS